MNDVLLASNESHEPTISDIARAITAPVEGIIGDQKNGNNLVNKRVAGLNNNAPPVKPVPTAPTSSERDLYSADQAKLTALTNKAIAEKDMVALQDIGNQMKALLNLPIPEGAVFSRFVKNENGVLTVNYYTEKNPTATDLLERGHESNSITISM